MLKCFQVEINNIRLLLLKIMDPIQGIHLIKIILQTDRHINMLLLT